MLEELSKVAGQNHWGLNQKVLKVQTQECFGLSRGQRWWDQRGAKTGQRPSLNPPRLVLEGMYQDHPI